MGRVVALSRITAGPAGLIGAVGVGGARSGFGRALLLMILFLLYRTVSVLRSDT